MSNLLIYISIFLSLLTAGISDNRNSEVNEDDIKTKSSIEKIIDATQIDLDCAEGAWERLEEVGCSEIATAESLSVKSGYGAEITDVNGEVYYIGLGDSGYLEVIYKDSFDNEPIFAYYDD